MKSKNTDVFGRDVHVFILRQIIQEKSAMNRDSQTTFLDLEKAYEYSPSVNYAPPPKKKPKHQPYSH